MAKAEKGTPTKEVGLPGPVNAGLAGLTGIPGWSYFFDSREYVPDLTWTGGQSGSTQVYRRMESDAQLKGLMLVIGLPVRRFRWELNPNEARPEVVKHVAESLGLPIRGETDKPPYRNPGFKHDKHMGHAFRALSFGHYHFERVYEIRDDGLAHLVKLATRPPWTIQNFLVDDHSNLEAIEQVPSMGSIKLGAATLTGAKIFKRALLTYLWDTDDDGDQVGRSMFRATYRNWLVKDALIRVDAVKNERNGMGLPWFEVDPGATEEQIKELAAIAEAMRAGQRGGGAGPGKLRIAGTEGSLPETIMSIRYHDQQMSRSFMANWMDLGASETGARALGETLMESTLELQGQVGDWYAEATQAQIDDEVLTNWGPDEQAPLITYTRLETAELAFKELALGVEKGLIEVDPELRAAIEDRWKVPGQRLAAEREQQRLDAETKAREDAGEDPALPKPPPPPSNGPEPASPAGATDPAPTPQPAAPAASGRPPTARSALAGRILETLTEPTTWPQLARAAGSDPKNGTARRARDELLAEGAITRRAGSGTLALALTVTLPDRELAREPLEFELAAGVDFAAMDATFEERRASLVEAVKAAQAPQIDQLVAEVEAAAGDAPALASLTVDPVDVDLIDEHLLGTAETGVAAARLEHLNQVAPGASLAADDPISIDQSRLEATVRERAEAASLTLASGMSTSASKKAAAVSTLPAAAAGLAVREHLEGLSDAALTEQLGGATQQSYNAGRRDYMRASEPRYIYASEILDANTCEPCALVDGSEYPSIEATLNDYPIGGYVDCEGGLRCRGTIVGVY